jgi:hypothetical protein
MPELLELDGLDGLDEAPAALDGLELEGLLLVLPEPELRLPEDEELEPLAPLWPASHSL